MSHSHDHTAGSEATRYRKGRHMKRALTAILGAATLAAMIVAPGAASAQDDTKITLLHGVPGVPVDVVVDGTVVISNFQPGTTTDLTSSAGSTLVNLQIFEAGTSNLVRPALPSVAIPPTGNHTFVVYLNETGGVNLTPFQNNMAATGPGTGRVTVHHVAQAAPVDVILSDASRPITNLSNADARAFEPTTGTISGAQLALAGGNPIAQIPPIRVAENIHSVVYVVGSVDDSTIQFVNLELALPAAATTTTDPNATTTTTDPNATTTTAASTTTSTTTPVAVPVAVGTGSPLDNPLNTTLIVIAIGALIATGGALFARRRVGS